MGGKTLLLRSLLPDFGELSRAVLREKVRMRVLPGCPERSEVRSKNPHPNPLPEYMEREKSRTLAPTRAS
jgi:hypothetical protein